MIYDPQDESASPLFAAPICNSDGSGIEIGVFNDEHCTRASYQPQLDVNNYLMNGDGYQMRLSFILLDRVFVETIPCDSVDYHTTCDDLMNVSTDCNDNDFMLSICDEAENGLVVEDHEEEEEDAAPGVGIRQVGSVQFDSCVSVEHDDNVTMSYVRFNICDSRNEVAYDENGELIFVCPVNCTSKVLPLAHFLALSLGFFQTSCELVCERQLPMVGLHCDQCPESEDAEEACWYQVDDQACSEACLPSEQLLERGLFDATTYLECEILVDTPTAKFYVGPSCSNDGNRVRLTLFQDAQCTLPVVDVEENVEKYIFDPAGNQLLLSYAKMDAAVSPSRPLSCLANFNDEDNDSFELSTIFRVEFCTELEESGTSCPGSAVGVNISPSRQGRSGVDNFALEKVCSDSITEEAQSEAQSETEDTEDTGTSVSSAETNASSSPKEHLVILSSFVGIAVPLLFCLVNA